MTESMLRFIKRELKETFRFRFVIESFVQTTLRLRYKRSVLGFAWSLLSPLLHFSVLGFVFKHTMRFAIPNYLLYVFSGAIVYNLISSVIIHSPGIFLSNEHYIKKIYIPKTVFVLNTIITEFVNFIFAFIAVMIAIAFLGKLNLTFSIMAIPVLLLIFSGFLIGIAIIIAFATVFFRDLQHVIPVIMQITFFLTPVMYRKEDMPKTFQLLAKFNPLHHFVSAFRTVLYDGQIPSFKLIFACTTISALTLLAGMLTLRKHENRIVFRL